MAMPTIMGQILTSLRLGSGPPRPPLAAPLECAENDKIHNGDALQTTHIQMLEKLGHTQPFSRWTWVSRLPLDDKGCWSKFFMGGMPFLSSNQQFSTGDRMLGPIDSINTLKATC